MEYEKLAILEIKAPVSVLNSFRKLELLCDYLEKALSVNVTEMGTIKRWLADINNVGVDGGLS